MHNYDLSVREEYSVVIARLNGSLYTATSEHPNWDAIVDALESDLDDDEVAELFDASEVINAKFEELSERVSVRNGNIYLDGELVDNALTRQVLRYQKEGLDFSPLVLFFEKVVTNPNNHSREQLFSWLKDRDFSITPEGDIVAYKSVNSLGDGDYGSIATQGKAIVNGEERTGSIRQTLGDVVTMPRGAVQHDPSVGCHTGLHAGTWGYASTFAGDTILTVAVNPRDVVSVPTDCGAQKIRTCRYKVLEVTENEHRSAEYAYYEDDDLGFDDYGDFDDEESEFYDWDNLRVN